MIYIITGNIASGKSTLLEELKNHYDYKFIDLDKVVHEWYKDVSFSEEIQKICLDNAILTDGIICRKKIANIFFNDLKIKLNIEKLITEKIIIYLQQLDKSDNIFIECPLYFEYGLNLLFDFKIILVYCDENVQLQRLMNRNNLTEVEARNRMCCFLSNEYKRKYSDILFDSSSGMNIINLKKNEVIE